MFTQFKNVNYTYIITGIIAIYIFNRVIQYCFSQQPRIKNLSSFESMQKSLYSRKIIDSETTQRITTGLYTNKFKTLLKLSFELEQQRKVFQGLKLNKEIIKAFEYLNDSKNESYIPKNVKFLIVDEFHNDSTFKLLKSLFARYFEITHLSLQIGGYPSRLSLSPELLPKLRYLNIELKNLDFEIKNFSNLKALHISIDNDIPYSKITFEGNNDSLKELKIYGKNHFEDSPLLAKPFIKFTSQLKNLKSLDICNVKFMDNYFSQIIQLETLIITGINFYTKTIDNENKYFSTYDMEEIDNEKLIAFRKSLHDIQKKYCLIKPLAFHRVP